MDTKRNPDKFDGPLAVHPKNPRYFTDKSGRAIYLTGSHTWENFQHFSGGEDNFVTPAKDKKFDFDGYLNVLHEKRHNFMRMWMWEQAAWMPGSEKMTVIDPLPYKRTGPGLALDGKPKFDLDEWNGDFFALMRQNIEAASGKGVYVSIMLFQGFSVLKPWLPGDPWRGHPYHRDNNVNGVDGDGDGDGIADIHSLDVPSVTRRQEDFVKKVIDTVNDLDNVLFEIINEGEGDDRFIEWEIHMTEFIHDYESGKPKRHPVGMTASGNANEAALLFECPAEWMSPNYVMDTRYKNDPPAADGRKIILNDTDHVENQLTVYQSWVWKCFTRGHHPVFMDPWDSREFIGADMTTPESLRRLELIRDNMGCSLKLAERVNLAEMVPRNDLATTYYCLASAGSEYVVYLPDGGSADVMLPDDTYTYAVEWFEPLTCKTAVAGNITAGGKTRLTPPFFADAVLYLKKIN